MCEIKAEKLLEQYDKERLELIEAELEALKPWRYGKYVDIAIKIAIIVYVVWFVEPDSFILENKFIILLILVTTGANFGETERIHKRIDVLIKLCRSKTPFKAKNT